VKAQCTCHDLAKRLRAVQIICIKMSQTALYICDLQQSTAYIPPGKAQQTTVPATRSAPCNFCIKRLELAAIPSQAAGRWPLITVLVAACCPDEAACQCHHDPNGKADKCEQRIWSSLCM